MKKKQIACDHSFGIDVMGFLILKLHELNIKKEFATSQKNHSTTKIRNRLYVVNIENTKAIESCVIVYKLLECSNLLCEYIQSHFFQRAKREEKLMKLNYKKISVSERKRRFIFCKLVSQQRPCAHTCF